MAVIKSLSWLNGRNEEVIMKHKWTGLFLALVLAFGQAAGAVDVRASETVEAEAETAAAEAAEAEAPALGDAVFAEEPLSAEDLEPGMVIHGFEVLEARPYEALDARVVLLSHQETGAKLLVAGNDDVERTFSLSFMTNAIDETGLPHVFEHSTLDGSEKYPSKSLFFNLSYQTYQSFMNAFTYDRMTCYPVASMSEAQLLKLADFYTDSCLNPIILKDESIFREEAWRYRLPDEESEMTLEGTVYSEMLGALDLDAAAGKNFLKDAFPGSWIGFEEGGDPDHIPEMTFESLKAYHDLYYHPSNCLGFLYGKFEHVADFLALLEEAFSGYGKEDFAASDENYRPLTESVENTWTFGVEADSDTANRSAVYYGILMPELEIGSEAYIQMTTLAEMLNMESSALAQKLRTALPACSLSVWLEPAGPEALMVFSLSSAEPEDAEVFRGIVREELQNIAENGLPAALADIYRNAELMSELLLRENTTIGPDRVMPSFVYSYAVTGNVWQHMEEVEAVREVENWAADGIFQELVKTYLPEDAVQVLSVTVPEAGGKEAHDAALAEKLAQIKAEMSPEELADIIAQTNAEEEPDDASAYVAQLQAVDVGSLPEEWPTYEIRDETGEDGIRRLRAAVGVDSVGIVELGLDASGIAQEDLKWARLLTELNAYVDSEQHTREELALLRNRYLYNGSVSLTAVREGEKVHPFVDISWISLGEDLERGYELSRELLFGTALDEAHRQQLQDAISALLSGRREAIQASPYSILIYEGFSRSDVTYAFGNDIGNLSYYRFLKEVQAMEPAEVQENLLRVREQLMNRTGALSVFAGDEALIEINETLSDAFFDSLPAEPVTPVDYTYDPVPDSYAMILDSGVCYNGYTAGYEDLGLEGFDAGLQVVTALVEDQFLYPLLRDQYGAYGVMNGADEDAGMYVVSYRDPNLAETYEVYDMLPDMLQENVFDQEIVDGYILSSYVMLATPRGVLAGTLAAIEDLLSGKSADRYYRWMEEVKAVTPETIQGASELYRNLVEKGVKLSAGGGAMIQPAADQFEKIDIPFGAENAGAQDAEAAETEAGGAEADETEPAETEETEAAA